MSFGSVITTIHLVSVGDVTCETLEAATPIHLCSDQSNRNGGCGSRRRRSRRVLQFVVAKCVSVGKRPWFMCDGIGEPIVCGHT